MFQNSAANCSGLQTGLEKLLGNDIFNMNDPLACFFLAYSFEHWAMTFSVSIYFQGLGKKKDLYKDLISYKFYLIQTLLIVGFHSQSRLNEVIAEWEDMFRIYAPTCWSRRRWCLEMKNYSPQWNQKVRKTKTTSDGIRT